MIMPTARSVPAGWRLESLLINAREPVILLTADRRVAAVNRAWEALTGFLGPDVVGLECRPHGPTRPGDMAGLGGSFHPPPEALAGQPTAANTLIVCRGGERLQRRVDYWPFHDEAGLLAGLIAIVRVGEPRSHLPDSERDSLRVALLDLRARMFRRHAHDTLIGHGAAHRRVLEGIDAAVASKVPVGIVGEPGTGKRSVARLIHQQGPRRQMPLLGYDCRAIPADLLDRELFGAPDDARPADASPSLVASEGSSLVIGDILHTPLDFQLRLANALIRSERSVRVIATTAMDLDAAFRAGLIQADLFHALTVLVIRLRPLRERLDEIPLLAQSLLERANLRGQVSRSTLSPAAIAGLMGYDWPGNIRELAGVIDSAHHAAAGETIELADLPPSIRGERGGAYAPSVAAASAPPLKDQLVAFERHLIEQALEQSRHNKTRAARRLGVNRPFLYRRIRELGIVDLDPALDGPDTAEPADGRDPGPGPAGGGPSPP